jgi:hypothetical protein
MRWVFIGIAIIILIGLLGFVGNMLFRPMQVIEKVTEPDRIIYTYEWFFNAKASIDSYVSQIKVASQSVQNFINEKHEDTYSNGIELARLREIERGLQNQLYSTVNQYNANAKNLSRTYFKDWRLPKSIEVNPDYSISEFN